MEITQKQIKIWNNIFTKATKKEKKILIAKDILANLKLKKYIANSGSYFDKATLGDTIGYESDLQENFNKIENCYCCQLGACLLSSTKFQNKLTPDDLSGSNSSSWKQLLNIFTIRELAIMEQCFEGGSYFDQSIVAYDTFQYVLDSDLKEKCDDFQYHFDSDEDRMKAICNNIIKGKQIYSY
tara:strand:- start:956 stop:1504 length:549 start_codon:yes stop_codon:yes gene_type:complete